MIFFWLLEDNFHMTVKVLSILEEVTSDFFVLSLDYRNSVFQVSFFIFFFFFFFFFFKKRDFFYNCFQFSVGGF